MKLWEHQEEALRHLKDGNILYGGVGSGKSLTAVIYYLRTHPDKNVYVITTPKKRDTLEWKQEFSRLGIGEFKDATVAGVLTIDSWNNIGKYKDVTNAFFIFDEQRVVGAGAWVKAFVRISKRNPWILLSATPGDTWMDYIPVFLANGFYKNQTEFKLRHVLLAPYTKYPKVVGYLEEAHLERLKSQVLLEMPFHRHTTRHIKTVWCDHNQEVYGSVGRRRWNPFTDKPIRDVGELFRVWRQIVNIDADRIEQVRKVFADHPRLIIFYNFNYELDDLREMCQNDGVPYSEWNGHKHESIPRDASWIYLVQYTAGAEGWNCVETNAMLFFSLNYSYKLFEQAMGRIDRANTPFTDLYYFVLMSRSFIDSVIFKALEEKRNFNENQLALSFTPLEG